MLTDGYNGKSIETVLSQFPVSLGGGKMKLSLHDVIPKAGILDLLRICEDFSRK